MLNLCSCGCAVVSCMYFLWRAISFSCGFWIFNSFVHILDGLPSQKIDDKMNFTIVCNNSYSYDAFDSRVFVSGFAKQKGGQCLAQFLGRRFISSWRVGGFSCKSGKLKFKGCKSIQRRGWTKASPCS